LEVAEGRVLSRLDHRDKWSGIGRQFGEDFFKPTSQFGESVHEKALAKSK
jgi:hypothetical protein